MGHELAATEPAQSSREKRAATNEQNAKELGQLGQPKLYKSSMSIKPLGCQRDCGN